MTNRTPAKAGPTWFVRDARLLIATRALRTFGYGTTSVLLADLLGRDGLSPLHIGIVLATASAGCVTASVAMGLFADRVGRRWSLVATAGLMALSGVAFAFVGSFPLLLAAAFIGTISPSTNDNTPFSGVEQSILAQSCPSSRHPTLFTIYNSAALLAGALGGLAAAGLSLQHAVQPGTAAFVLYGLIAVILIGIFRSLSAGVEPPETPPDAPMAIVTVTENHRPRRKPPEPKRPRLTARIRKLSVLFAVDAFSGGLAVQAILALYFQQRYHVSTAQLGLLFFAANLLPAVAQLAAPAIAARGGLLATMLGPHAAANLLVLLVPAAPTFGLAATLLLIRQTLSKIDVPARQAFTAAAVTPAERTAAASMTTVARSIAVSVSPLTSSLLLSSAALVSFGVPLLLSGAIGISYDLTMWRNFRDVELYTDGDNDHNDMSRRRPRHALETRRRSTAKPHKQDAVNSPIALIRGVRPMVATSRGGHPRHAQASRTSRPSPNRAPAARPPSPAWTPVDNAALDQLW